MLRAYADIATGAPEALLLHLRTQVERHGLHPAPEAGGLIYRAEGMEVSLMRRPACIRIGLAAPDAGHLAWLQEEAGAIIAGFSGAEGAALRWSGVLRPTPEMRLALERVADLLPGLRRFSFRSSPAPAGDGWHLRLAAKGAPWRYYTISRQEGALLDIDVVMHSEAALGGWAARAKPGDALRARGPGRAETLTTDRIFAAADLSGAPALARLLRENPAARGVCVIAGPEEIIPYLAAPPGVALQRVNAEADLAAALRAATPPPGALSAWFAGEAESAKAARRYFSETLKLPPERRRAAAYWRRGAQK